MMNDKAKPFPKILFPFGKFGGDEILWCVLDYDSAAETALVIADGPVCMRRMNPDPDAPGYVGAAWQETELHAWLCGEFFDNSFTDEEKAAIVPCTVTETLWGEDPDDLSRIFRYDQTTCDRILIPDRQDLLRFPHRISSCRVQWWLRSKPDEYLWGFWFDAARISDNICDEERMEYPAGVRPMMKLNLTAPCFDGSAVKKILRSLA